MTPGGQPGESPEGERTRLILETANDAFVAIDESSLIIEWNRQAEVVFGWSRQEAIGRSLTETIIPERFRDAHRAGLQHFLDTGEGPVLLKRVQLAARRRDGSELPIELTISPLRIGSTYQFNAFLHDISERERSQGLIHLLQVVAVAANEADTVDEALSICLAEVCAHVGWPVGHVYVPSKDGTTLQPSDLWHLAEEGTFETLREITAVTPLPSGVGLPGRVFATGKPVWITDVTTDTNFPRANAAQQIGVKAGFAFPVRVGHEIVAVLEFFSPDPMEVDEPLLDVMSHVGTQLGRVVERQRVFEELRALSEMKSAFLQAVSHDLRTPLATVYGASLTLASHWDELGDGSGRQLAERIAAQARKLERLVTDLLDLDRLGRGIIEPRRQQVNLAELVDRTIAGLDLGDHPLGIDVADVTSDVDPAHAERILENLLVNVVRHTPAGTPAWISVHVEPEGTHIVVGDAGPGVPEELRTAIFDPFRHGFLISPHAPGTGVGLSLVAKFAELHGGRAWVEPRNGGGASFHVLLAPAA